MATFKPRSGMAAEHKLLMDRLQSEVQMVHVILCTAVLRVERRRDTRCNHLKLHADD